MNSENVIDSIRNELIQSIQNGTIKIESGNEELFNILDKYKTTNEDTERDRIDSWIPISKRLPKKQGGTLLHLRPMMVIMQ